MYCRFLALIFILLLHFSSNSQINSRNLKIIDSLNARINFLSKYHPDAAECYQQLGNLIYVSDLDSGLKLFAKAVEIADSNLKKKNISSRERKIILGYKADALHDYNYNYLIKGYYDSAITNYKICYNIYLELGDEERIGSCLNSLGYTYNEKKEFKTALEYYSKSLTYMEKLQNERGLGISYTNIGQIYNELGDTTMSLDYFHKGLRIFEKIKYEDAMSTSYNNIGFVYSNKNDIRNALKYYRKSLIIGLKTGSKESILTAYNNIGAAYSKSKSRNEIDSALSYYKKSLALANELESKYDIALTYNNISSALYSCGRLNESKKYALEALEISKIHDFKNEKMDAFKILSNIAKEESDYKSSEEYFKSYTNLRDSIYNRELISELARYEYQQKLKKDSLEFSAIKTGLKNQLAAKRKESILLWSGAAILVVLICLVFNSYLKTKKNKNKLEADHSKVSEEKENISKKMEEILRETEPLKLKTSGLVIPLDKIEFIEANRNYVLVYSSDDKIPIAERTTFQELISQLPEHQFVQIHRSFCVNKNAISAKLSKDLIRMRSGTELKVSRSYANNL